MAVDPTIYARNLEVRLTALQQEFMKYRARLQKAEQRIYDLENDVSEVFEPSASDGKAVLDDVFVDERPAAPSPVPKFSLKQRRGFKFAVQNVAGDLLTADLPKSEAQAICDAFLEKGMADLQPHQVRDAG